MTKRNTKNAGFSLIELLFAMLFMSIIVFGVIKLQTSNLTLSNTKQLELKAHSHATQGLEIVTALGKSDIGIKCPSKTCYLKKNGQYEIKDGGGPELLEVDLFERSFEYTDLLDSARFVTMTVGWTDSSGSHSASVKRIISN